jgi:uncharacterized protein (TIGR03790 family)
MINFAQTTEPTRGGWRSWAVLAWTAWLLAGAASAQTNNPGDEVVVVYNKRTTGSKAVAEHYAERRLVPKAQVIGLDLPTDETISRATYQSEIHEALARLFAKKGFWKLGQVPLLSGTNGQPSGGVEGVVASKVRYLVLCYGMPLRIMPETNLVEAGSETMRPEMQRSEAAVDSELALLPWPKKVMRYFGPANNPVYTATNAALINPTNGVLMVSRLDGLTPAIASALVDKAIQAETDGLWGRAYFDLRGITNGGYELGDRWIGAAASAAAFAGFETVVDTAPEVLPISFPLSHVALYAGWYTDNIAGPFILNQIEFMPGAFAYHLHSFSAHTLRSKTAGWTGPLIAKGATASMGSVWEPYLGGTPDVGTFLSRWLLLGFTFGEAACAGQSTLSWMTTVVGDPLYRPFGRDMQKLHETLARRGSPLVQWSYLRAINSNRLRGFSLAQATDMLEQIPETKTSPVLLEKLGDLCRDQGKPASAAHAWTQALKQNPSLQQRIRIMLNLAAGLLAAGRDADSLQTYREFLTSFPDYHDRLTVLRAALPLAEKLQPGLVEIYRQELNRLAPSAPPPPSTNQPAATP